MTLSDTEEKFLNLCRHFWNNRVAFAYKIVGVSRLDPQQEELLRALDEHDNVTCKAGHGTGKSADAALALLHYISTRPNCKIPTTAPSKHQLFDVLWPELNKWHGMMKKHDAGLVFARNLKWNKETFVNLLQPEEWFAVARTATKDKPEALQGFHADYVFKIVDEASGVSDEIIEVMEGATGLKETKALWLGNPTRREGAFYRSFTDPKEARFFKQVTMSCLKSSIAPKRFIERMAAKYGVNSNIYKVRVLGEFPDADGDSFIPLAWAEDALYRDIPLQINYKKIYGVDVARNPGNGDRTVIAVRQGDQFLPYQVLRYNDTMKVANHIARMADKDKPEAIFIDVIGFGAGVYDRLKELGYPAIAVNVAETRSMEYPERYARLRDELWGKMRDWLEIGRGRIWDNDDRDLIGELTLPQMRIVNGKIKVESKEEMKARLPGVGSPDVGDAHNLTFAQPVSNYNTDLTNQESSDYNMDDFRPLDEKAGY